MAVDVARSRADVLAVSPAAAAVRANDLYVRYRDRVYGFCLNRLGSSEEAEDVVQTTFLYALRGLRRGVEPEAEAAWLFTIARNACRERYRARRRRPEVLSDPQVLERGTAAAEGNGHDILRLEEALARVPEQQRLAFVLREWRGLSYREIAAEMDVSLAAVETLIFRARRTLAELLTVDEDARPKRRYARSLDLGSLVAGLKSVFSGGSAAKLAAAAAVVSSVVVVAGTLAPLPGSGRAGDAATAGRGATPALASELGEQRDLRSRASAVPQAEPVGAAGKRSEPAATQGAAPGGSTAAAGSEENATVQSLLGGAVETVEDLGSDAGLSVPELEVGETTLSTELPDLPELSPAVPPLDAAPALP